MNGSLVGGVGLGLLACILGVGGILAAIRRYRRRASIAATYGQTGGIAYTVVQTGCSGLLVLGGLALLVIELLIRR
jgi:thiol:disulfide interchange protein